MIRSIVSLPILLCFLCIHLSAQDQRVRRLADIEDTPKSSFPRILGEFQGKALMLATLGSNNHQFFISDGTAAGTKQLHTDIDTATILGFSTNPIITDDFIYYSGGVYIPGFLNHSGLWQIDEDYNTELIYLHDEPNESVKEIFAYEGGIFFIIEGDELFHYEESTGIITNVFADVYPEGLGNTYAYHMMPEHLFLRIRTEEKARLVTVSFKDLEITELYTAEDFSHQGYTTIDENYFYNIRDDGDRQLWVTDGTFSGTKRLAKMM